VPGVRQAQPATGSASCLMLRLASGIGRRLQRIGRIHRAKIADVGIDRPARVGLRGTGVRPEVGVVFRAPGADTLRRVSHDLAALGGRTHDAEAGVVTADALFAALTLGTGDARARIAAAGAGGAGLPVRTLDACTRIIDARAVDAALLESAAHRRAARHAGAVAAELAFVAEEVRARIGLADEVDAALPFGAAGGVTIRRDAGTARADLVRGARHTGTRIDAEARLADLPDVARHEIAGRDTDAVDAAERIGALVVGAAVDAASVGARLTLGAGRVVVDGAVAVVVFAVAGLGRHVAAGPARVAQVFVDDPVAVVVLEVAQFVGRLLVRCADLHAALAGRNAACAVTHPPGAADLANPDHAIVDERVAVVVEAVADLGARRRQGNADDRPALARALTGAADARQVGLAGLADAEALVRRAVTVVVEAVADLVARHSDGVALDGAVATHGPAVGADAASAGVAPLIALGVALVDLIVTVVVEAIAELGRRQAIGHALDIALDTVGQTGGAGAAEPGCTGHAPLRVVLVDLTIAVVVDGIADLGPRHADLKTEQAAGAAVREARRASARLAGITVLAGLGVVFVALAVAIVVPAVADLRPGLAVADALHATVETGGEAACALTRDARVALHAAARIAFVRRVVAVVVEPVADLVGREELLHADDLAPAAERQADTALADEPGLAGLLLAEARSRRPRRCSRCR
jgi:hypothetical protein